MRRRENDPIAAAARRQKAQRRVGVGAACSCGEMRPEALLSGRKSPMCYACDEKKRGKSGMEAHHVAGRANHPGTIEIPANDHRANLSVAQYGWPQRTRENPDGSPLLAGAGCIRGISATIAYLFHVFGEWVAIMLEALDKYLAEQLGSLWWRGTELEQWEPHS